MTGNNYYETLTSSSDEGTMDDYGGPLLIPALMFLIIACFCAQTCFCVHRNYPHWFIISVSKKDNVTKSIVMASATTQDDEHQHEVHNKKQNPDLFAINNNDVVPTTTTNTRPKMMRTSSCHI
jgi:hypothetical protein